MAGIKGVGRFAEDMKAQVFGELVVINRYGITEQGRSLWRCLCICGSVKTIEGHALKHRNVKSCGHYKQPKK